MDVQDAIIEYNQSSNPQTRNKIYEKEIRTMNVEHRWWFFGVILNMGSKNDFVEHGLKKCVARNMQIYRTRLKCVAHNI